MTQPIIKKTAADQLLSDLEHFNFSSLERAAADIIARARKEADAQITRAKAEVEKLRAEIRGQEFEVARKQGYDKGFEEGVRTGNDKGYKEAYEARRKELQEATGSLAPMLQRLLERIEAKREALMESAERDLLALALMIADKVVHLRVADGHEAVKAMLRQAVELVLNRASLDVTVSSKDHQALEEHLPALRKAFGDLGTVRLHADDGVEPGGVSVRSGRGEVAIHINEQIDRIAREILAQGIEEARARVAGSD